MNEIVKFTSPSGDEMIVVSGSDFRRLVDAAEMAEDVAIYDEVKRRIDSGEEEMIPAKFVDRILDGENKVRVWREFRDLSPAELAAKAGVGEAELSGIEADLATATVGAVRKIAAALRLNIDDLVRN